MQSGYLPNTLSSPSATVPVGLITGPRLTPALVPHGRPRRVLFNRELNGLSTWKAPSRVDAPQAALFAFLAVRHQVIQVIQMYLF